MKCLQKEANMAKFMLGNYRHSLDEKNRFRIPVKFREGLGANPYYMPGKNGCLYIVPEERFEEMFAQFINQNPYTSDTDEFTSSVFAFSGPLEEDAQGRVTLDKNIKEKYGISKVYEKIDDVFADENVDIIYISTPHNTHMEYLRKALTAGKHVLCEKSITLNSEELKEAVELAEANHVILAEAMTIYHMPIYRRMNEVIQSGKLGPLRLIQMNFGSYKEYNMSNRFFNRNLAGGALLDIGVYALSFVRWFMTSKPDQVLSQVKYAPSGVDEQAGILLKNQEEEMATVMISLHAKQPKRGTISFEKGYVELFEYPRGEEAVITYTENGAREILKDGSTDCALRYEVEDMELAVSGGENRMCLEFTRDVMDIMTEIRDSWGLKYPEEERKES